MIGEVVEELGRRGEGRKVGMERIKGEKRGE